MIASLLGMSAVGATRLGVDAGKAADFVVEHPVEYDVLKARYELGDTTLTMDEVAIVYWGCPYATGNIGPKADTESLDRAYNDQDYAAAYILSLDALASDPVSLDFIVKAIVSEKMSGGRHAGYRAILANRYDMLTMAILLSGDGSGPESPFVVNSKSDQFRMIVNVMRPTKIIGYSDVSGCNAVKITLPETGDREHILYFRILH